MKTRLVILGGGFGGLAVARSLYNAAVSITLIDRSNHHLFQPLLYQVATAGLSPADIAAPIRSILKKQSNVTVLMAEVQGLDLKKKLVLMEGRQEQYDVLVVATGASYNYFGHAEWQKYANCLKCISDATEIRKNILLSFEKAEMELNRDRQKAMLTFVIVGAGPTGVEMAGSIAELAHYALKSDFRRIDPRATRIILIEAGPRILAGFPQSLSEKAEKKLRSLGVEFQYRARVEHVDADGVIFSGQRIYANTVIWAAGVIGSPAGQWLQAEVDPIGRVRVESDLTVPGHRDVFVIGDTACCIQNGKPLPGLAPVAKQQGHYVAMVIRKRLCGEPNPSPFQYKDKGNLATVGRSFAVAEIGKVRIGGFFAWLLWVIVHIYYLIGFRSRLVVLIEWAWAYFTFQRGARLITNGTQDET